MSVTLEEILGATSARAAVISAETAGYLVLGLAEQAGFPTGPMTRRGISVLDDGSVRAVGNEGAPSPEAAEKALRLHLGDLLAGAPGNRAALSRIATGGARGLSQLAGEIEAALIPLNRSAAKRALARLCRDVTRAKDKGRLVVPAPRAEEPSEREAAPVFVAATEESPVQTPWSVVVPVPSPVPVSTSTVDGEATPFLGGWPSVIADARRGVAAEAPDTDRAPEVRREETTWPLFRRAGD